MLIFRKKQTTGEKALTQRISADAITEIAYLSFTRIPQPPSNWRGEHAVPLPQSCPYSGAGNLVSIAP